jgi:hypothetical protein
MTKEEKREKQKQYYENNKEIINKKQKQYYENNKQKILEKRNLYNKIYKEKNKEKRKETTRLYTEKTKEKQKKYLQNWRKLNPEKAKEYNKIYHKTWRENNKEKISGKNKIYNKYNIEYNKNYYKKRKQIDPLFKLKCNLGSRMNSALKAKKYIKSKCTIDMLGCDFETFKAHLEKQFTKGMTWNNKGEWHIDHIIPCASAKTEEELIKLFHYTNLQPLWAFDNLSKGSKIIEKQLFLI